MWPILFRKCSQVFQTFFLSIRTHLYVTPFWENICSTTGSRPNNHILFLSNPKTRSAWGKTNKRYLTRTHLKTNDVATISVCAFTLSFPQPRYPWPGNRLASACRQLSLCWRVSGERAVAAGALREQASGSGVLPGTSGTVLLLRGLLLAVPLRV